MHETTPAKQTLIGESPQIKNVINDVHQIAGSVAATTLIIGDSGTGKELVARLIHHSSPLAERPFIDINCGAIPESLLESELFGYEKGAFTGAQMRKKGLFELANGGTIFLDEIGNTTESFQMKLLKVVEYKSFRRIGGTDEIHVSTRVIAATNVDLYEAVQQGKFREDLYYRLNVFQIRIPPLRERGKDILLLADSFVNHFKNVYRRPLQGLAPSAQQLLLNYTWPGNVRQLKNAIERAIVQTNDEWLHAEDFRLDSVRQIPQPTPAQPVVSQPSISGPYPQQPTSATPQYPSFPQPAMNQQFTRIPIPNGGIALETFERDIILSAVEKAEGNLSKAARLLKISRGKLRYRMERLNISQRDVVALKLAAMEV
ncbi:sigma-54-dependent Fis family transcriptional regulator [candidate division KSB1 bacterium]|nr:sigma-54-dependent Fis family transcriptional regulator [candidate division KSB1 bacterium]